MTLHMGIAIFVKTPGHSSLKTRLAAGIGRDAAECFHLLSAQAVAAVARSASSQLPGCTPTWAVAEAAALNDSNWAALPRIEQGDGNLGVRMGRVVEALQATFGAALLLGADTPQIEVDDVLAAARAMATHTRVIGPSSDGGFWLFATRADVPTAAWTQTPWSQEDTAARFCDALGGAAIARLRHLRDVDAADDLAPLRVALDLLPNPLPEQTHLANWLHTLDL